MLENIRVYKAIHELKIICGMEVWKLSEAWKELVKVCVDFARN